MVIEKKLIPQKKSFNNLNKYRKNIKLFNSAKYLTKLATWLLRFNKFTVVDFYTKLLMITV